MTTEQSVLVSSGDTKLNFSELGMVSPELPRAAQLVQEFSQALSREGCRCRRAVVPYGTG